MSCGPYSIEPAGEGDSAEIARIVQANSEAPQWTAGQVGDLFRGTPVSRNVMLARRSGLVAGFAVLAILPHLEPVEAELESIAVAPESKRQGIGRALLSAVVEHARTHGVDSVRLEVRKSNAAAIALYGGCGFVATGVRHRYYTRPEEDAVLMERKLRQC